MKAITIFSVLILMFTSSVFGESKSNNTNESATLNCDCTSTHILDCMQTESQFVTETNSAKMTILVLAKMKALDSVKNENDVMDRLQKETEDVSITKPIFAIAALIEKQINKHQNKHVAKTTMK